MDPRLRHQRDHEVSPRPCLVAHTETMYVPLCQPAETLLSMEEKGEKAIDFKVVAYAGSVLQRCRERKETEPGRGRRGRLLWVGGNRGESRLDHQEKTINKMSEGNRERWKEHG